MTHFVLVDVLVSKKLNKVTVFKIASCLFIFNFRFPCMTFPIIFNIHENKPFLRFQYRKWCHWFLFTAGFLYQDKLRAMTQTLSLLWKKNDIHVATWSHIRTCRFKQYLHPNNINFATNPNYAKTLAETYRSRTCASARFCKSGVFFEKHIYGSQQESFSVSACLPE